MLHWLVFNAAHFSIHAARTGRDCDGVVRAANLTHFNPRSPHGERRRSTPTSSRWRRFQSTLPARGATATLARKILQDVDFNPRSPHGERHFFQSYLSRGRKISIHAPRTGSDAIFAANETAFTFQSTLPARGATEAMDYVEYLTAFQSTLPARGATRHDGDDGDAQPISIHAPRTGSDVSIPIPIFLHSEFQSTLPARGAT